MDISSLKKARTRLIGNKIYFYREIGSTNDEGKHLARLGIGEGAVVIADLQTRGRGKPGRSWFSPAGKGIYLSILIQPFKFAKRPAVLTLLGTLAAARTLIGTTHLDVKVKWPNDIMVGGKKLGGVLTETCAGKHGRKTLIVGIGLNLAVAKKDLPRALKGRATSVTAEAGRKIDRTRFAGTLLEEFESLYFALLRGDEGMILDEWMTLSETIGRRVRMKHNGSVVEGTAKSIGKGGELIIKTDDGRIHRFSSGDILF